MLSFRGCLVLNWFVKWIFAVSKATLSQRILSPGQTACKSMQVSDLRSTCVSIVWPPTCVDLHRLATTCVDLRWLWSISNLDASRRKFFYRLATRRRQVDTSWSQVICCYKNALTNDMRKIYGFLRLASRLVNPFDHPSQVCTQVMVSQTIALTCVDLGVRLARALVTCQP